jgi:N-acylglucosamine-6-phosphate 2-epimerase
MFELLEPLHGRLVVSCQAREQSPLRNTDTMIRMAIAAQNGGAAAIRANGPDDVAGIRDAIDLPIIGLWKDSSRRAAGDVYITPTVERAQTIASSGAQIVAVDGTNRTRKPGEELATIIRAVHESYGALVMADIATQDDAESAQEAGADMLSTTLSGYTPDTRDRSAGPDLDLVAKLATAVHIPVFAEGRIRTPKEARSALKRGAFSVVVGTAITDTVSITQTFASQLNDA